MEPIFGTLASESHSLSTINIPVVTQIEENEEISESHFAFYASKLLTFKYGGRYLTSSMFPLIFNKNNKKWCESVHSFGSLVLGMMLKRRNLIKAVFVEPASSSSSSSLDVYVTPKRIIYERYILGEVSDEILFFGDWASRVPRGRDLPHHDPLMAFRSILNCIGVLRHA